MGVGTTFTSAGEAWAVDLLDTGTQYVGWGTGTTTPAKGDTGLETPASMQNPTTRRTGTRSQALADKLQWLATLEAAGTITINEVGLFDAAGSGDPPTGGNLVIHAVHTAASLSAGDKVDYTITLEAT